MFLFLAIIGIPTYFICKWLFNMIKIKPGARRIGILAVTLVLTPLIYLGFIRLFLFAITSTPEIEFEKSRWIANKTNRFKMAEDIIESEILVGKDSNQVKQIIGHPTWRSDSTYQLELRNSWFYDTGSGPFGFGVKFYTLIVKFDKNKVVNVIQGGTVD